LDKLKIQEILRTEADKKRRLQEVKMQEILRTEADKKRRLQEGNFNSSVLHHRLNEYFFVRDNIAVVAPTKCGSTSMRFYLEDRKRILNNNACTYKNKHGLLWQDAETRIVVIREPIQRYYSGVLESVKYIHSPDNVTKQTWQEHWDDHVNPIYMWMQNDAVDFKYIHMHKLSEYINSHHWNNSMDHNGTISKLYHRMKDGREPLLSILYERDREWLDAECERYQSIVQNMSECSVEEFKDVVARLSSKQ